MGWRALWIITFVVLSSAGCRSPEPRPASEVVERARARPHRPTVLDRVHMSAKQRARVNALVSDLDAEFVDYQAALDRVVLGLIECLRKGAVDEKLLEPRIRRAVALLDAGYPKLGPFAETLHRELDDKQRKRLVTLLRDDDDEELSEEERAEAEAESLTRVIDLTSGQKTRLSPGLFGLVMRYYGTISRYRSAEKEALAAFESERFVAKELAFFTDLDFTTMAAAFLAAFELGMGVLEPSQRETLAAWMEVEWRGSAAERSEPATERSDSAAEPSGEPE